MAKSETPSGKAVDDEDPSFSPMTERGSDDRAQKTVQTVGRELVPKTGDDIPPNPSIVPSNPD